MNFSLKITRLVFLLSATLFFLSPSVGICKSDRIENLEVTIRNGELRVSARLVKAISNRLVRDIANGVSRELFYYIVLKKKQKLWMDEDIESVVVKYLVRYDLLKKQYYVTVESDGMETHNHILQNFIEVKNLINQISDIRLATVKELRGKQDYYVSVKAVMMAKKLPFFMDYLFFFIPILEVDTPWKDSGRINK